MITKHQLGIKITSGPDEGSVFIVENMGFVGAGSSCSVCLTDPGISTIHARIKSKGNSFSIADLTSDPDMKINGLLAKARPLVIGDKVSIASTVFEIIDAQEASGDVPEAVVVVSKEKNSITQIIRAHEDDALRNKAKAEEPKNEVSEPEETVAYVEPVEEPEDEALTAAAETMKKYRERTLRSENTADKKRSAWPLVIIVALVSGVFVGVFFINRTVARGALNARFHAALEYSATNPEDVASTIASYKSIATDSIGVHGKLAQHLSEEVIRLENEVADAEKALAKLLKTLDDQAGRLIAAEKFDKAIEVYKIADADMAKKVIAVRADRIRKIRLSAERHEAGTAAIAEIKATASEKAKQRLARAEWAKALPGAVDALVAGDDGKAIEIMELVRKIVTVESVIESAEEVIAVAREVMEAKKSAGSTEGVFRDGLSPAAKAVLAIVKEDFWNARSCLAKTKNGEFKQALFKHVRITDDEMVNENRAIRKFADIWNDVTGNKVTKIEKPKVCIETLRKSMTDKSPEDVKKIRTDLLKCQADFMDTMFIAKYAEVFESLDTVMLAKTAEAVDSQSLFDGKVIQVRGDDVFVELDSALSDPVGMSVGIFSDKTVFVSLDRNKAVAVLVDVKDIVPIRVISDKQIMYAKPTDAPKPEPGQPVLLRKELSKGKMLINNINMSGSDVIYHSDFEKPAVGDWSSGRDGRALQIKDGRLTYFPAADVVSKTDYLAGAGDMRVKTDALKGPVNVEFDLLMGRRHPLVVSLGDIDFMIGASLQKESGIYLNGVLAVEKELGPVSMTAPVRVVIERGSTSVSLSVGSQSLACKTDRSLTDGTISAVKFFGCGQTSIDNFTISKSGASANMSEVAGISIDTSEVLFIPSKANSDSAKVDVPVYLFVPPTEGKAKPTVIDSVVSGRYGDIVVSRIPDGTDISAGTTVSFTRAPAVKIAPATVSSPAASALARTGDDDVLIGSYEKGAGTGVVTLGVAGHVPERGYLSAVSDILVHPETKEPLAAVVSGSVRAIFSQDRKAVSCRLADGGVFSEDTSKGVLLSSRQLAVRRAIDIKGAHRASASVSLSSRMKKNSFWQLVSGDWTAKTGRVIATRKTIKDEVPIIQLTDTSAGNSQFDLDFRLGDSVIKQEADWGRNLMVEVYFPSRQSGVTFGIDAGAKGVLVTGRTLSLVSEDGIMSVNGSLPNGAVVVRETGVAGAPIGLTSGTDYRLRIRRVGNILEMLVNGKRLAYVKHDDVRGSAYLRLSGSLGMLSVGKTSVKSLPEECVIPEKEPELGEFGYVIFASGNQFLIDSDMNGLEVNGKVSVMKLDNVIQGEKSRTVILKRVAKGVVSEVGPRTSKILVTEQSEPVARGLKVFLGARPDSLILTDEIKRDLNRGF